MDEPLTAALWDDAPGRRFVWHDASYAELAHKADELKQAGMVILSLDVCSTPAGPTWAAVWEESRATQELANNLSLAELRDWNVAAGARGRGLVTLRAYRAGGFPSWSALWRDDRGPATIVGPLPWNDFWSTWVVQHAAGQQLVDLDGYDDRGIRLWTAAWRPGSTAQYLWVGSTWSGFWAKHEELRANGYSPVVVRSYVDGNERRWAGCWQRNGHRGALIADLSPAQLWPEIERQLDRGLRLCAVHRWVGTGYAPARSIRGTLVVHVRVLFPPTVPIELMLERMREVYEPRGIAVELGSFEALDRAELVDIDVGACSRSGLTAEQDALFALRPATSQHLVAYFVRTTIPPFNGCAAHPDRRPGVIVSSYATEWTLAHELGHVLGLGHVADNTRLMTGLGTGNLIDPPPDLTSDEVRTMFASAFVIPR